MMKLLKSPIVACLISASIVGLSTLYLFTFAHSSMQVVDQEQVKEEKRKEQAEDELNNLIDYDVMENKDNEITEIVGSNGFGITASDIVRLRPRTAIRDSTYRGWYPVISQFEQEDGTLVETAMYGTVGRIRLWTYQLPNIDYPSTIVLRFNSRFRGNLIDYLPSEIRDQIPLEILENSVEVSGLFDGHRLHIFTLDYSENFDFGQLPVSLADFAIDDFFMVEERGDELVHLRDLGDLDGMEALIQAYVDDMGDNIEAGDTAFWLLGYIEYIRELTDPFASIRHSNFFSNLKFYMAEDRR